MNSGFKKFRLGLIFTGLVVVQAPFQNCSPSVFGGAPESRGGVQENGSNGGFDGKPINYVHHGDCSDSTDSVDTRIVLMADEKSALLTRENCVDLKPARPLSATEFLVIHREQSNIIYKTKLIMDQEADNGDGDMPDPPRQRITLLYCVVTGAGQPVTHLVLWTFTGTPSIYAGAVYGLPNVSPPQPALSMTGNFNAPVPPANGELYAYGQPPVGATSPYMFNVRWNLSDNSGVLNIYGPEVPSMTFNDLTCFHK